jgi:hypothetical protein
MTIAELRPYQDKTVILNLHDGETATVKIAFVDADEDIIVDLINTNRPEEYKGQATPCIKSAPLTLRRSVKF